MADTFVTLMVEMSHGVDIMSALMNTETTGTNKTLSTPLIFVGKLRDANLGAHFLGKELQVAQLWYSN